MKKHLLTLTLLTLSAGFVMAQPRYDKANMKREKLNRGVVAIRQDAENVVISWRTLASDKKGEAFDIYRNGQKLNDTPLTTGGTFFIDKAPLQGDATYEIRGGGNDGSYTLKAGSPNGYIPIKLNKPADGYTPDGRKFTYSANDASVGDVDGDGQYEIFLKWDPSNAHDNAHTGFTGSTLFDCYRLNGEHLWRIDLGRNIRSGAHYVPFIVYDLDGDGRAELMVKTADGTIDGRGKVIGDAKADWRGDAAKFLANFEKNRELAKIEDARRDSMRREWEKRMKEMEDEHTIGRKDGQRPDQRQMNGQRPNRQQRGQQQRPQRRRSGDQTELTGRIMEGPEFITVFNGLTGEAMDSQPYYPERGNMGESWGDTHGNRSERYLACLAFLDGRRPSAVFCRGYYPGRTVIAAWNWDGKKLSKYWTFDTKEEKWRKFDGQGFHSLRVGDVDADGKDEIIYGSMVVDHDGTGLYNTGFGHGDALHMTAFDPSSDKLQVWTCHENRRDGSVLRDAATGKVYFQIKSNQDVGRAMAADIDPRNPGVEMWTLASGGVRNIKGEVVTDRARLSTNFAAWWDGDLLRELLNGNSITKYDWTTDEVKLLARFEGASSNNGSKSTPSISGDIIGDWREEVVLRSNDSNELRVYVSTIPTDYRIDCLMEDVPYRLCIAQQNAAYNQPPHTGFYLGPDKTDYLK